MEKSKLLILIPMFMVFSVSLFSVNNTGEQLEEIKQMQHSDEIPRDVLNRFYNSFIFDETNNFRGAFIGEMLNYTNYSEIERLIYESGAISSITKIFEGYKPKLKGCKRNSDWVCTLEGELVDL